MNNEDTNNCFRDVLESIQSAYPKEEILLLTPRDIRSIIKSWAKKDTDINMVEELIKQHIKKLEVCSKELNVKVKDTDCTREEKFELLRKSLLLVEENLKNCPVPDRYSKCDLHEFNENMIRILESIHALNENKKTRLLNALAETGYNYVIGFGHYPFLNMFLHEVIDLERYIFCEIQPSQKQLYLLDKAFHPKKNLNEVFTDKELLQRLEFYRKIGVRNKYPYAAMENGEKWNIPFKDFAMLYRKLFDLTNRSILSPYN